MFKYLIAESLVLSKVLSGAAVCPTENVLYLIYSFDFHSSHFTKSRIPSKLGIPFEL